MGNVGYHLMSGAASGLASTVVLQPFDLLKTRLQQGDSYADARQNRGVSSTVRGILKDDGIRGLWRGTLPSLLRNVPGVALYMTSLSHIRVLMASSSYFVVGSSRANIDHHSASVLPKLPTHGNLLAGAVARVAVGFVLNPFSVLKARYESNIFDSKYRSLPSAFASMAQSGSKELFRGFVPSAMRDAPYAGIFVALYEGIKRHAETTSLLPSTAVHTASAAAAGAIATMITHPFDVIKTKMQVRQEDRYYGLRRTMRTIWERGMSGFFDGSSLRVSRKVFSSAIGWAVYEGLLIFMHKP